jgi:hypothetical protein
MGIEVCHVVGNVAYNTPDGVSRYSCRVAPRDKRVPNAVEAQAGVFVGFDSRVAENG